MTHQQNKTFADEVYVVVQSYIGRGDMIQRGANVNKRTNKSNRERRDKGPGASPPARLVA